MTFLVLLINLIIVYILSIFILIKVRVALVNDCILGFGYRSIALGLLNLAISLGANRSM